MTVPVVGPFKHYTFHLVNGEAIEADAGVSEVAFDGDWLVLDLPQGRVVQIARRHITHIWVRDIEGRPPDDIDWRQGG